MLTLKQLETWFVDVESIIMDISMTFRNLDRLSRWWDGYKKKVPEEGFFRQMEYLLKLSLVIQLCKLFVNKDSERRNFRKLFNRLKYEPYDKRLKKMLKENSREEGMFRYKMDIVQMTEQMTLKIEKDSGLLIRLKTLRDRLYAHSDPGQVLPELTLEEMERLTLFAVEIYSILRKKFFDGDFKLIEKDSWDIDRIIEQLSGEERINDRDA